MWRGRYSPWGMFKTCRKCLKVKQHSEFYRQPSNKDGLNSLCKPCLLRRFEPVMTGIRACRTCQKEMPVERFSIHRTNAGGRMNHCKDCMSAKSNAVRHARPVFAPAHGERLGGASYIKRECEACERSFEPIKGRQKWCAQCNGVYRDVRSHLGSGRNGRPRASVPPDIGRAVAVMHIMATSCAYCGRAFSAMRPKSIDHVAPVARGGATTDLANLEIVCLPCNRSKAWMTLEEWVETCELIAIRAASIVKRRAGREQ